MKREFLTNLGLGKEDVDKIMEEYGKAIKAAKVDTKPFEEEITSLKEQLEKANTTIDGFKDYEEVKGQVEEYKRQLAEAEAKQQEIKADYEFNAKLEEMGKKYNVKSLKALKPFLEVDTLKASKNQNEDIDNAFKTLKESEENSFLFGSEEPINNPVASSGNEGGGKGLSAFARAMGLTEKDF